MLLRTLPHTKLNPGSEYWKLLVMATEIVMNVVTYHITLDMQLGAKHSGTTEEHSSFRGAMNLPNGLEDHVPIWATEVGGSSQTGDGILFSICVVNHNVGCIVGLDLCSEVLGAVSLC